MAKALIGGVRAHLDGEGLRGNALAVAGGNGELIGAGCRGRTFHNACALKRHAGGQRAGDARVIDRIGGR